MASATTRQRVPTLAKPSASAGPSRRRNGRRVSLREYVVQALRCAEYERDHSLPDGPCVVTEVPQLPGCFTQVDNYEEARENLIDAIEVWVVATLRHGGKVPPINGYVFR
ncbi:MAG: type II toxin-antitoxin system HicB family antitoxin [Armatimonadetes bacterium]|nr:type II toxin-antitoxin system HicB family antitoxin [Armatimonadota bacterium]